MKKILVVDDEYDLLETICATLEMGGYHPVAAPNARVALEQLDAASPELVLTDVMMPYMSGYDLVDAIRGRPAGKELPVIIMSAIDPQLHPNGRWNAVLAKPFTLDTLLETVEDMIGKPE
jgi:CheY-like chemotaxis protein